MLVVPAPVAGERSNEAREDSVRSTMAYPIADKYPIAAFRTEHLTLPTMEGVVF
jgi:hypothetical protein